MDEISIGIWNDEIGLVNRSTRRVNVKLTDNSFRREEYNLPMDARSYTTIKRGDDAPSDSGWLEDED